jgi:uncharacterized protein
MKLGPNDVQITRDVMTRMRDGIELACDIYRPAHGGVAMQRPQPVVLNRTPYNKLELDDGPSWPRLFASHGYVAVVQDCRGCYASEGEVDFLWPEAEDGYDTLRWITEQAWCDGRVAMWGTSWQSWTQTAAAAVGAPGLTAIVPNMSGSNAHSSSVRHGGALELRFIAWAFWHSALNRRSAAARPEWIDAALNLGAPQASDWLTRLPIRRGVTQLHLVEPYERWALDIATRGDFDDRWAHPSVNPAAHVGRFPEDMVTLLVGGWYDSYARGTLELFQALTKSGRGTVRAIMGPWIHGSSSVELSVAGDVEFGHDAALDSFADLHLQWYGHWLRGTDNGFGSRAPLRIFVMGGGDGTKAPSGRLFHGGKWRDEYEWPLKRTVYTPYYLHVGGALKPVPPEKIDATTTYMFNPADPVPTIGGNFSSFSDLRRLGLGISTADYSRRSERLIGVTPAGGFDQRERHGAREESPAVGLPLSARADVVVFETDTLTSPVEITGPITVRLWVSSSAPDTDFTAKLIDLYPPSPVYPYGYALNITDSIIRLRYRNGERAVQYKPGDVTPIDIVLYPTSNLFMPGHRIRLDISSSNFPRFDVNPNTGDPLWTERRRRTCENTIFHDAKRPSHIVLPVVPR